jgi:NAD(P)H dehydrogenase (quinone)
VGYAVLRPFIAYGVEAGLRYSDPAAIAERLKGVERDLGAHIAALDQVPVIPFNRMAEWGADGRVTASPPAYSPFVRHRKELELGRSSWP